MASMTAERRKPDMTRVPSSMPSGRSWAWRIMIAGKFKIDDSSVIVPLSDNAGRPWGVFGLTLYQLGGQARITDPAVFQGRVTLYPCADLPVDLP